MTPKQAKLGTHVLRHTYITSRLEDRVPPTAVAYAVGDTVRTILAFYAHAVPDDHPERLRVDLDAIVGASGHPMGNQRSLRDHDDDT